MSNEIGHRMSARFGLTHLAGTAPDAAAALPIGSQIEAHSVLQVLSEGPNGFVYLTRDAAHGATRVLKEFMPRSRLLRLSDGSVRPCDVSDSIATSVARIAFMNEANLLAAFQHPALIRVLGVIPAHRTLYRVMPLVEGVSLEQHCRTRAEPPSLAWLYGLLEGLLQALQVLHERRLGHGSVRPAQVMVRESGQPLLLGFASVARELDAVSPTPWQSPGAAHLTRHAPPVPADDLPALAATVYFAATGLQAPSAQPSEGEVFDWRQALGALPDGPGDTQQRRRGLLSALEAAFAASALARPQSVAEFRRLLTGDGPTRGGRYVPTPRWVGEMPARDATEVDLLIPQPAPLADDLPSISRPAAAAVAPVVANVVTPVVEPVSAPVTVPFEHVARMEPTPEPEREAAWPLEPASAVEPVAAEEPVEQALAPGPSLSAEPEPAPEPEPELRVEPSSRSNVERDFAATEFLVASAETAEPRTTFPLSAPDTEASIASLRPEPLRRPRSPYAAMAAVTVLALVGVGIAGWWYSDPGQVGSAPSVIAQAPAVAAAPVETLPPAAPAPLASPAPSPPTAPAVAVAPEAMPAAAQPEAMPPVAQPEGRPAAAQSEAMAALTPPSPPTLAPTEALPAPAAAQAPPPLAVPPAQERAVASPPLQTARGPRQQRTASATAARTGNKQAAARSSAANARPVAAKGAGASRALRSRSPLAACGNRTQFSLVYCMQQQCAQPAYRAHPQCADVRNGG